MAKRTAGVTEKLMECAKEEFLTNGYENASLRVIAEKAGSSKGAIYIRYPDKESLYRSLVQPAMDAFCGLIQSALEQFNQLPGAEQTSQMYSFSDHGFWASVDYIYDHFDEFRLLLDGAEGTQFACFLDELVDIEVDYTYKYMEVIGCESVKSGLVTEDFIHIIVTAYFNGMFEVVRHNMSKADAVKYVKLLNRYHMQGFSTVFNPAEP